MDPVNLSTSPSGGAVTMNLQAVKKKHEGRTECRSAPALDAAISFTSTQAACLQHVIRGRTHHF